jgi:predicted ATP-grasp superfamily ATP-dependent carboligase
VKGRVLIAGFATRHVAESAFHAGYPVYAVDHFCDQDLSWYTQDRIKFDDLEDLPNAIEEMCHRHKFDLLVVTSGAEDLKTTIPICGTSKKVVVKFLDKLEMQQFFEELKVPVAGLVRQGEFPAMIKPRRGAGGWRNTIVKNETDITAWKELYPDTPYLLQKVIEGVPSSVCCVADGYQARAIAVNEQILRGQGISKFGFSGSVTPFNHALKQQMVSVAERIAASSGCVGTVGIDFVVGKDAYTIEINPRFQATVDTIEKATGFNVFQCHMDAYRGILPNAAPEPIIFAARNILFADQDINVHVNLKRFHSISSDIPWPDTFFEKDHAIISVYGWGSSRHDALMLLDKNIKTVQQYLR